MAKSKNRPASVVAVATYAALEQYARAFADGHLNLLPQPLLATWSRHRQESNAFAEQLDRKVWTDRRQCASALGIYRLAHEHRRSPLVLDDVDGLYRDRQGIRLLKALCQTDTVKIVSWHTAAASRLGLARQFATTSRGRHRLANQWTTLNADVAAPWKTRPLLAASLLLPSKSIARRPAGFWDQQVFDFVASALAPDRPAPHCAAIVLAWELKQAGPLRHARGGSWDAAWTGTTNALACRQAAGGSIVCE